MPILDPLQQFGLFFHEETPKNNDSYFNFLIKFLNIASIRLRNDLISFKDYVLFENYFLKSINSLNQFFSINIPDEEQLLELQIDDYFQYLHDKIKKSPVKYPGEYPEKSFGNYYYFESFTNLYGFELRPNFTNYPNHYWFFTKSSFAVLTIWSYQKNIKETSPLIDLEVSLFKSLGLCLVLVCDINPDYEENMPIYQLIKKNFFSEIHINFLERKSDLFNRNKKYQKFFDQLFNQQSENVFPFYGFFYLYFSNASYYKYKKRYKSNPFVTEMVFSLNTKNCLNKLKKKKYESPFICSFTGSKNKYIEILLLEVPIFDQKYEENTLSPSRISTIETCFVKHDDFLFYQQSRVEILFKNNTTKYVNFNDIHLMKPELFVDSQLHLMKSSFEFHDKLLKNIKSESKELKQKNPVFKKMKISKILYNDTENIKNNLIYLSYALSTIKNIDLRDNQLFTAFKACSSCLFSNSFFKLEKGIVYQLDTGEGKSYIIQIIAALLASYGYFVHIASSNIYLAKRDYSSSFVFFNNLNIKSSVLLHQNELGTSKFYGDEGIEKDLFNSTSFNDENFKNSLTMNFCACGYDNDFKPIQNPPKIVFSTFVNFEAFYLKLIENVMPSNVEKYYDTRALIVDEADSILIDDLTNGTILSRPISSNAKSVLTFVYRCKMGLLTLENLKKIVKFFSLDIKNKSDNDEFIKDLFSHYNNCVLKSKASEKEELLKFLSNCSRNQLKKEFLQKFIQKLWPKNEDINEAIQIYNKIEKNKKKSSIIKMNLTNFMNLIVFLCQTKIGCLDSNVVLEMIKNFWPNSFELTIDTIKTMFQEIELVQMPEFVDGRKYSIQPIKKNKVENIKSKFFLGLSKLINLYKYVNEKSTGPIVGDNNKNEEEEDDDDEKELEIVPFDYDKKGILERNKEFGGFIQQFIAIKEIINNPYYKKTLKIKDIALNYSFVTHPVLVKLYNKICGFTGTIGNKNDIKILDEQYKISTLKIPRNSPNHRIDLPIILCNNSSERNIKIVEEVLSFHLRKKPVLVILQDLNEIKELKQLFISFGIKKIKIFDSNDDMENPEDIVGKSGEISLGTNFCGRGTDIKIQDEPLHVIVTYYSRNVRVLKQAFGRTARNGASGSCRIICVIDQFVKKTEILDNDSINKTIYDIPFKRAKRIEFFDYYRKNHECIFDNNIKVKRITNEDAQILKTSFLNVNRMKAVKYKYPLGMSVDTFLNIQSQKIFSLYNCPDSKYTWMLFQRYLKEMLIESWVIMINDLDTLYNKNELQTNYNEEVVKRIYELKEKIRLYIPEEENDLYKIYINIFNVVKNRWEKKIKNLYKSSISFFDKVTLLPRAFFTINFGFMPYSLVDGSGSRIMDFDKSTCNIIKDPEIAYYHKLAYGRILASITEKIDLIFNKICDEINETIGGYTGLKFFLRRTLAGCEFGVCIDFLLYNVDFEKLGPNCLFDKDPLLLFTIQIKNKGAVLAGILIIVLVYVAKICSLIFNQINQVSVIGKKTLYYLIEKLSHKKFSKEINELFLKLNEKLYNILQSQISKYVKYNKDSKFITIISFISNLCYNQTKFSDFSDGLEDLLGNNFKMNAKLSNSFHSFFPHLIKLTILIFLCIAVFFYNFKIRKEIDKKVSKKYNIQNEAENFDKNQNLTASYNKNQSNILIINPFE